jgi:hypothetical protein
MPKTNPQLKRALDKMMRCDEGTMTWRDYLAKHPPVRKTKTVKTHSNHRIQLEYKELKSPKMFYTLWFQGETSEYGYDVAAAIWDSMDVPESNKPIASPSVPTAKQILNDADLVRRALHLCGCRGGLDHVLIDLMHEHDFTDSEIVRLAELGNTKEHDCQGATIALLYTTPIERRMRVRAVYPKSQEDRLETARLERPKEKIPPLDPYFLAHPDESNLDDDKLDALWVKWSNDLAIEPETEEPFEEFLGWLEKEHGYIQLFAPDSPLTLGDGANA